jgi:hypothetical protein
MGRKTKVGRCRICRKRRKLDPHHIISQHRAKKINQEQLIRNPGNIVFICRKCHNQTTASLVRHKMAIKDKNTQQEVDVLFITVESLEAELSRLKSENKNRMKEVRDLAGEEIAERDSHIGELEDENSELREQLELLDKLSLEYQIARGTKKILRQVRKDLVRVSKDIEGEIKREVKGAVKSAKKIGSEFRKRTGL